jgi:hypothetical protein
VRGIERERWVERGRERRDSRLERKEGKRERVRD